jgi:probable rRNA maturation factor
MRKSSIESGLLDRGRPALKRNAATMALPALPETEVLIVAECWGAEADAEAVVHRAIETAAAMVEADTGDAELAVMLTDDSGIRTLNKNWRGQDKPTNVRPPSQPSRRPWFSASGRLRPRKRQ